VDLNTSARAVGEATARYISDHPDQVPLISSHCPTIVRLIQVRYPDLVELISPIDVPREITAREVRKILTAELRIPSEDIGIIYISPCPAKIVSIKQPADKERSWFDGAVSIIDMFTILYPAVVQLARNFDSEMVPEDFNFTSGWAVLGGITASKGTESWLAVSGLNHVMRIFDDIENSRLSKVDFVEAEACMLGCIGGSFYVESPYVARANFMKQMDRYYKTVTFDENDLEAQISEGYYMQENRILPRPTRYLETDLLKSIRRMRDKERIYQKLMQVDCGLCGSPNCMAFAEDVVRGEANLTDCVFLGGHAQVGREILASRRSLDSE
jgi:iron only hydrogenase large subunit-like protein